MTRMMVVPEGHGTNNLQPLGTVGTQLAGYLVLVLEADINPRAVPGWPDAVRQLAHWNGRDLKCEPESEVVL